MASLAEFYLATLWLYQPMAIKQVIDELEDMGFDHAEFTYDAEYSWFKVTCREDDASRIREQFVNIAQRIENTAFAEYDGDESDYDDDFMPSFRSRWFSQVLGDPLPSDSGKPDDSYCLPKVLAAYSHTGEWKALENDNEPYTINSILSDSQSEEIQKELDVSLSSALAGKLVYIAGHSEQSVRRAQQKLSSLLTIRKLLACPLRAEHVVYAEDYVDPSGPNFYADIRYLANIDPKLASSTLLDRLAVDKLEEAYKTVYKEASSIRLCAWAPDKEFWVSLLGPAVAVRAQDRTILGHRPTTIPREIDNLVVATEDSGSPGPSHSVNAASHVETWIEKLPCDNVGSVTRAVRPLVNAQTLSKPTVVPGSENLIDFTDPPSQSNANVTPAVHHPISALAGNLSAASPKKPGMSSGIPALKVRCNGQSVDELSFTGEECLIDQLASVKTESPTDAPRSSIHWKMRSLIPLPSDDDEHGETDDDEEICPSATVQSQDQTLVPILTPQKHQLRPQQATAPGASDGRHHVGSAHGSCPNGFQGRDSDGLLATQDFVCEIEAAMIRLLQLGPYRRGKVAVCAELGRAILEGVHESGLAFNDVNTPSNGWKKPELVKKLNQSYGMNKGIQFTKVLSTYACDIEDMINITSPNGTRLWAQKPSRAWTIYSFHCALRSTDNLIQFIVDIEDDGTSSGVLSYSVRPHHDPPCADRSMPVYVHAIRRHWDMQIVLSQIKSDRTAKAYECFAKTLLQSLSISHTEKGAPELKFAVHNRFAVDVKSVRVLTKWRYLSPNEKSALEITEVQQLETIPYAEGLYAGSWNTWEGKLARPWSQRRTKENRSKGEFPRWYEAAVVSPELEEICRQNSVLAIGDKADWNAEDLKAHGILDAIYSPGLQMLRAMDLVGRRDDNNLSAQYGGLLLRRNAPARPVPGLSPARERMQRQGRGRRRGVASDGPQPNVSSTQSGTASVSGSSAYPGSMPPFPKHEQPGFW